MDAEVFYEDFPDQLMKVNSENEEVVKDLNVVKTAYGVTHMCFLI